MTTSWRSSLCGAVAAAVLVKLVVAQLLAAQPRSYNCLPPGVKATDVVSAQLVKTGSGGNVVKKTTVAENLRSLKAQCRRGTLVDGAGKEVYFYRLTGCWGNPPMGYQEILDRQSQEIKKLKERYTVIEMTCNPSGLPLQ